MPPLWIASGCCHSLQCDAGGWVVRKELQGMKLPHFSILKQIIHVFAGYPFSLSKWHAQDRAAQQKITCYKAQCQSHRVRAPTEQLWNEASRRRKGNNPGAAHPCCAVNPLWHFCSTDAFSFTVQCKITPAGAHAYPLGEMHPSHLPTLSWQLSCLLGVTHTPFPAEQGNYTGFHTTSSKLKHSDKNPQFCKARFL